VFTTSRRAAVVGLCALAWLSAAPLAQAPRTAAAPPASDLIKIPFETYALSNGLTVILSVDHTTPTVAVDVWYHVGSKNERPGRTGFAHLFEHVMFTGSRHVPYGLHDKLTEGVGGSNNGTTSNDRTTYFETVPSNYLESSLWIESDRMGFLLDTLDIAKLNAQRDVVKNERRQGVDNQPYGRVQEILAKATYPANHPYSWDVIGSMEDLTAASENDVKDFFRLYYAPNNAILSIVGDFDPAQAKAWVSKYFSGISKGAPVVRPVVPAVSLPAEQRLAYEDKVQVARLYVQWPTVGEKTDDSYALDVLGAVLSGSRTARLTKALVYDQQAAATAFAGQNSNEDVGEFLMMITPRPGHSLTDLEAAADSVIAALKKDGPTDEEIRRVLAGDELSFLRGLESNLGKALQLANGAGFHGDAGYFRTAYQKSQAVTAADVKRVANRYLTNGRVVLSVVPVGKLDQASKPAESLNVTDGNVPVPAAARASVQAVAASPAAAKPAQITPAPAFDRSVIPPAGKTPVLRVPAWTKSTLSNGAELIVSEKHGLPLVAFSLNLLGGAYQFESPERRGLASLVASMMSEGTKTRDGEALSNALQLLGTSISTGIGAEAGSMGFVATSEKFAPALDILADMLVNSTFPADALDRLRAQRLVALAQAKAQPAAIASRVFPRVLYGEVHPYGAMTTEDSLKAITRDDVAAFHRAYFQPGRAAIVVTGDVNPTAVKATLEKALAAWPTGGSRPAFSYPPLAPRPATTIYLVDKPGAAQSTFAIGLPGPPRDTPDYYALQVMNTILGGFFQSRLNANIREDKGYSYGVSSSFAYGRGPGAFRAGGDIASAKTDAALVEFMKELRGIKGTRPVTDEELATAKDALVQRLPGTFASVSSIGSAIGGLWLQGLPDRYYQQYGAAVAAVTKADVQRVTDKYLDLDHLAIVIVGDRASIEAPLKATGFGPIVLLDIDGKPAVSK
jgi:zinc protease